MLPSKDLFSFAFIKKTAFTGSFHGMNYRIGKEGDELAAYVFPGPYAFDYTADEVKQKKTFPFTQEGYDEAKKWLDDAYSAGTWPARER